jgi:hypothetical protein
MYHRIREILPYPADILLSADDAQLLPDTQNDDEDDGKLPINNMPNRWKICG